MRLKITDIPVMPGDGEENLPGLAADILGISPEGISKLEIMRKSLDARRSRPPFFIYAVVVTVSDSIVIPNIKDRRISAAPDLTVPLGPLRKSVLTERGPLSSVRTAGLFAPWFCRCRDTDSLIERGRTVPERIMDLEDFGEEELSS